MKKFKTIWWSIYIKSIPENKYRYQEYIEEKDSIYQHNIFEI